MKKSFVSVESCRIPTYLPAPPVAYPMFAENRIHQRTSGDPYPNTVVLSVNRDQKTEKEYTLVVLENAYLKIGILPEIGGRIYYALDKRTGYDFFYHQHVIKPALIGVLGNWVSGGVEFNQPFHHSPSGFLPYDFETRQNPDGSAECILSGNDPIERIRCVIHIILPADVAYFTTRVDMDNRTETRKSFLFWANAAVPVNENYRIFFPPDVRHVNFHYLKSRTTFPVSKPTVYNGIKITEPTDISYHKNTRDATSYFAAASAFDFFGGYDEGRQAGVVHIADHTVSPGKKMFTWGYNQLSKSWENALTDTDGAYAELMAGSYSDNQPNFSWLAPYEVKTFEEMWYPLGALGVPSFATLDVAVRLERQPDVLKVQTTSAMQAVISVKEGERVLFSAHVRLSPDKVRRFSLPPLPRTVTLEITKDGDASPCLSYTEKSYDELAVPEPIGDMPEAASMTDPDALYLAGIHVKQYRDPAVKADVYFKTALERNPNHIPSLIAMAEFEYDRMAYTSAFSFIERAVSALNCFNERHESGRAYYLEGLILLALGEDTRAYNAFASASWCADCVACACTQMALLDRKDRRFAKAKEHAKQALLYGVNNPLALSVLAVCGETAPCRQALLRDPSNLLMRLVCGEKETMLRGPAAPMLLDTVFDLKAMGEYRLALTLLQDFFTERPADITAMLYFVAADLADGAGEASASYLDAAETAPIGDTYPHRHGEFAVLKRFADHSRRASLFLGCMLYHNRFYAEAAAIFEKLPQNADVCRLSAIADFSHLNRPTEALALMKKALAERPTDAQLVYETAVLMTKTAQRAEETVSFLGSHLFDRDDIYFEYARALVRAGKAEDAIDVLLSRAFVPCEGGEHAVAEPYLYAHMDLGLCAYHRGDYEQALHYFQAGQLLPQSLGAGIWNRVKLVPLRYHEACTLQAIGRNAEADAIFSDIASYKIDYFTNMHLSELPFFIALSLRHLHRTLEGDEVMTHARSAWESAGKVRDNGFFGTTPFFICFADDPSTLRQAQLYYRLALLDAYRGDTQAAKEKLTASLAGNADNFLANLYERRGFIL